MLELQSEDVYKKLIIENDGLAFVDFYATWCMPCKMMSSTIEEIDNKLGDKLLVMKVDIDKFPDLAKKNGVMAVPTMLLFNDGMQIEKFVILSKLISRNRLFYFELLKLHINFYTYVVNFLGYHM